MTSMEVLRLETAHYRLLVEQLKSNYANLDDETLRDTMEGISELPQQIEELVRSALEDEILITGLKFRLETMNERMARLKDRYEKKRGLAAWAMGSAGIPKMELPDFGVSLCAGQSRLVITDPDKLLECYLVPQPAKPDRSAIAAALKRGVPVDGTSLEIGNPFITVRAR